MEVKKQQKILRNWTQTKKDKIVGVLEKERFLEVISPNDFQAKLHWKMLINHKIDLAVEFINKEFNKIKIN